MLSYVGNGPYCYANSAAMLLDSVGEAVEPRLLEVLSGCRAGSLLARRVSDAVLERLGLLT